MILQVVLLDYQFLGRINIVWLKDLIGHKKRGTAMIEDLISYVNTICYQLFKQVINEENELVQIKEALNYE